MTCKGKLGKHLNMQDVTVRSLSKPQEKKKLLKIDQGSKQKNYYGNIFESLKAN